MWLCCCLHEVTWCMVAWCTQNVPRQQQFHMAPAMSARHHFGRYSRMCYKKLVTHCRITCECCESAQEQRTAIYEWSTTSLSAVQLQADTVCTWILSAVQVNTVCTWILSAVQVNTVCTWILSAVQVNTVSTWILSAVQADTVSTWILSAVQADPVCTWTLSAIQVGIVCTQWLNAVQVGIVCTWTEFCTSWHADTEFYIISWQILHMDTEYCTSWHSLHMDTECCPSWHSWHVDTEFCTSWHSLHNEWIPSAV